MKLIDITAQNDRELTTIKRKVAAFLREKGPRSCNVGDVRWGGQGAEHWVEVDTDGELASDLAGLIQKSPNALVVSTAEHKGSYVLEPKGHR